MTNTQIPKNIKRNKPKTYTKKRNNYKPYLSADFKWNEIFIEIDKIKNETSKYLKLISNKYGIKYSTLSHKYNKYREYAKIVTKNKINQKIFLWILM